MCLCSCCIHAVPVKPEEKEILRYSELGHIILIMFLFVDLSLHLSLSQEPVRHRGMEGGGSPQGYPFYLPIGSPPRAYSFPSSIFIGQNREKQLSPEPSLDGQLACRWMKVNIIVKTSDALSTVRISQRAG